MSAGTPFDRTSMAVGPPASQGDDPPADLILTSGMLWDDAHLDGQEALAVGGGRIIAIGSNAEVDQRRSNGSRVIDVGGRRVMPGLIDSHLHMVRAGLRWTEDVRWHDLGSLSDGLALIAKTGETRDPGEWIAVVGGWHPSQFTEGRPPSRDELDQAAPENPVFVQRNYIEAFLNTRALEGTGWVDSGVPEWPVALQELREKLTAPDFEAQVRGTETMLRHLNRLGLTGCIDAGGFGMDPEAYRPVIELYERGERGFRARLLVGAGRPGREAAQLEEWMSLVSPGSGDAFLRYLGAGEVLLFGAHDMEGLDGRDISGQTADLAEVSRRLAEAGWPVHLHAILDDSVTTVLDAWQQTGRGSELTDLRYTITHADQIGEDNLHRISDMGLGVTVQNGMALRGDDSIATWGRDRVRRAPPLRAMIDLGIPIGGGTDGTVVSSPNPWRCIGWMVSGERGAETRLTLDEALRLYTSGSAWFSFEEESRGNLRVGSNADVVVLSDDPLTVPEDEIALIESVLTVVGGHVVYSVDL